jgi:ectoine hydroxylase-related dioxygenase (phytanoyl-CoA dioxygenase family)
MLRAGDLVLAHYQLAHSVAQNLSPQIRYAIHYRLAHRDTRYDWSQVPLITTAVLPPLRAFFRNPRPSDASMCSA